MLTIYFTSDSEVICWGQAPQVGDLVPGTDQTIDQVEFYQGGQETVCLALCRETYGDGEHSFDVQIAPDRSIIGYSWNMEGQPTTGRLMDYEPTGHETLMRPVPTRWYVDLVETCKPLESASYRAIHLCYCINAPMEAVA